jgi:hypothetical protein
LYSKIKAKIQAYVKTLFFWDMAERAAYAYLWAFIAVLSATASLDVTVLKKAAVAGIGPALSILKSWVASHFGDQNTAGFTTRSEEGDIDPIAAIVVVVLVVILLKIVGIV